MYENKNLLQNKLLIFLFGKEWGVKCMNHIIFLKIMLKNHLPKAFETSPGHVQPPSWKKKKKKIKKEKKSKRKKNFEQLNKVHKVFIWKRYHWSENSPSKFWLCKLLFTQAWTTFLPHQNYSTTIHIHGQLESMYSNHYQRLA